MSNDVRDPVKHAEAAAASTEDLRAEAEKTETKYDHIVEIAGTGFEERKAKADAEAKAKAEDEAKEDAAPAKGADEETPPGSGPEAETSGDGASPGEEAEERSASAKRRERQRAAREATETELKALKNREAELARGIEAAKALGDEPKRDDFEDEASYYAALGAHTAMKRAADTQAESQKAELASVKKDRESKETELKTAAADEWKSRLDEAKAGKYPDMEDRLKKVAETPVLLHRDTLAMIKDDPNAIDILAHFGTAEGVKDLQALDRKPPVAAAMELGRLKERMSRTEPQPKKVTDAPDPKGPVKGAAAPTRKDPSKMSQAEYNKARAEGWSPRA